MILVNFKRYIEAEKRMSSHTVRAYMTDIEQFLSFYSRSIEADGLRLVTHFDIRGWIVDLMDRGVKPRSIHRKISSLNRLFVYALQRGIVMGNPISLIVLPKVRKGLPFFVGVKEMDRLFDSTLFLDGFSGERDRAILALFYCSGVRLSELVSLKLSSYSPDSGVVRVIGKRDKERLIPIPRETCGFIDSYIRQRGVVASPRERALFLTDKGKQIYDKFAYRIVKRYLAKVTTVEKKSPHVLRHTYATHMLNRGAELGAIKELLGHASIVTTQEYTHSSFERLKDIYKQAHPRAKKVRRN